jgi:hypothetical protein
MFIREFFIFGRIVKRVDLGIDSYGAAFFRFAARLISFMAIPHNSARADFEKN